MTVPPVIPPARPAGPDDLDEIRRLAATVIPRPDAEQDDEWCRRAVSATGTPPDDDIAVFVVDNPAEPGQLAAGGLGRIECRCPDPDTPGTLVGHVQWVTADDRWRRSGSAGSVLTSLLAWFEARNVAAVELDTAPDQPSSSPAPDGAH
jgi:hypothetical protein